MHYSRFVDSQKYPARKVRRGNDKQALPDFSGSFRDALPAHFLKKKNQGLFSFQYGTTVSENERCHCLHESHRELPGGPWAPAGPPHLTSAGLYFSRRQRREGGSRLGWTRWTAAPPHSSPGANSKAPTSRGPGNRL